MAHGVDPHHDLLFGLLALQNGMIHQGQLVAAFAEWTVARDKAMADVLVGQGVLSGQRRALLDALVDEHVAMHGSAEESLAAIPTGRSTRESLARLADPRIDASLQVAGRAPPGPVGSDETVTYAVGSTTSEGQRFRVLRPHARGGLGAVFVALDEELHREVALKQILDHHADDAVSRQRFLLEAEITGGLEHPGIVPVYGLGSYGDGRPFYAMRFVRGDSLKEAIERFHADRRRGRRRGAWSLELRKLLRRFTDVCNAIQYAHDRGVLHRDIKPGNVIVGKHGETLVIDWGLAKPMDRLEIGPVDGERPLLPASASGSADTLPGSALGTPAFMSPEQACGDLDRLGPRSDVYSLGATLYCLLTGKPPFEGEVGDVIRDVQRGEFPPPRAVDPTIDRALAAICLTAMAVKPEDRYASCRGLVEDIERWTADEPVSVHREAVTTRLTRWGRRHRTAAASVGVLLVTAVVALSVGAVLINRERAKAEANFRQARAAVDRYFTTVSESRLLDVPGLQPLRKQLLDAAQEYYRDFLEQRGDDPAVRAEAASASFRVGWINRAIGRPDEALGPFRTATALYQQLVRDHPGVAEYRRYEAIGHGGLGLLLAQLGQADEALRAHREALAIREVLAKAEPRNVLAQNDVSRTHRNIGDVHRLVGRVDEALAEWGQALAIGEPLLALPVTGDDGRVDLSGRSGASAILREDIASLQLDRTNALRERGRLAAAEAALRQARDLFEALLRERPGDLSLRAHRGNIESNQGALYLDLGRNEEAQRSFRKGIDVYEGLAAENPRVTEYRSTLAELNLKLNWTLGRLGRPAEASAAARKAIEMAESLLADQPDSATYQSLLVQGLGQSARILLAEGRANDAVAMLRRSLETQESIVRKEPRAVTYQSVLASTFRAVGRAESAAGNPTEARDAFERACKIDRSLAATYPAMRYNLACSLALMIPVSEHDRREGLGTQAIEALRKAIADGYANRSSLEQDPDLDALRSRDDFKALIREVPGKPGRPGDDPAPALGSSPAPSFGFRGLARPV